MYSGIKKNIYVYIYKREKVLFCEREGESFLKERKETKRCQKRCLLQTKRIVYIELETVK